VKEVRMKRQREAVAFREPCLPYVEPCRAFGGKEREEVILLVQNLLRREGLRAGVECSTWRLSIALPGIPSNFESGEMVGLLAVLMAVAHLLKDSYGVDSGYILWVDFWEIGHMATTVGKSTEIAGRMNEGAVTPDDFWGAFDFRIHDRFRGVKAVS